MTDTLNTTPPTQLQRLEVMLLEYIALYGLTDCARDYFLQKSGEDEEIAKKAAAKSDGP